MRLVYIYLNAYWPNMHLRNEEKPLKENHAGRCLLCRAPVAKKTAVMFWELRASGDDEDMVITNDETRQDLTHNRLPPHEPIEEVVHERPA